MDCTPPEALLTEPWAYVVALWITTLPAVTRLLLAQQKITRMVVDDTREESGNAEGAFHSD